MGSSKPEPWQVCTVRWVGGVCLQANEQPQTAACERGNSSQQEAGATAVPSPGTLETTLLPNHTLPASGLRAGGHSRRPPRNHRPHRKARRAAYAINPRPRGQCARGRAASSVDKGRASGRLRSRPAAAARPGPRAEGAPRGSPRRGGRARPGRHLLVRVSHAAPHFFPYWAQSPNSP